MLNLQEARNVRARNVRVARKLLHAGQQGQPVELDHRRTPMLLEKRAGFAGVDGTECGGDVEDMHLLISH